MQTFTVVPEGHEMMETFTMQAPDLSTACQLADNLGIRIDMVYLTPGA